MAEVIQRSFSGGEITSSLYARVDQIKYATGLRTCRNWMIKRHGGAQNRPGTVFVGEVKDSSTTVRLIPFIFNTVQTYILEFGNLYMRAIRNGSQVTETAQDITDATRADPVQLTIAGHGYSNGDEVFVTGVGGMTQLNNRNFKVANVATNTFTLQEMDGTDLDGTAYTPYTLAGTAAKIFEIVTPYLEADLMGLRFAQSADVITIVHPSYAPRELARTGHTAWTLTAITFTPSIATPANVATDKGGGALFQAGYSVSAVTEFGEEGLEGFALSNTSPTTSVVTITWDSVTGANSYRIVRNDLGDAPFGRGRIGEVSGATVFRDDGTWPIDIQAVYPQNDNPFGTENNYPAAVAYYQGRLVFAGTNNNPETVWMSHSGSFKNLSITFPSLDSTRVIFTMAGSQVNSIQHMIDIGTLIMFTSSGEWAIKGNDAGIVTPTEINPLQQSYNGTGGLVPIIINDDALYVQARGTKVRSLSRDINVAGYTGPELTIFASHLFDNFTIEDWAYQKIPDSTIWAVRDDGVLLALTYIKEHQILAWHRHDFENGLVERTASIPSGNEDIPYFVIKRTINGKVVRYIEHLATRQLDDIEDSILVDASLSFDGTNAAATTMTLSGGSTWKYDETLTLTASAGFFVSTDVGNQIHLTDPTGVKIRFTIEGFTSTTIVTGKPHKTVPTTLRATAVTTWALAVDELTGLWHLEGEEVSILADGFVVGSPNNPAYTSFTVTNGVVTLDKPAAVIHVGLPITADIETLDIDTLSKETMADKKKLITHVAASVEETRGLWSGERPPSDDSTDPLEGLREFRSRNSETQEEPPALQTEVIDVNTAGRLNKGGRVFIRQVDPVPATILSIVPGGFLPDGG